MLSASTISSSSSSAFSTNAGVSTPSSQYSTDSRRAGGNPLTELIDTEQSFMETLKMIDSVRRRLSNVVEQHTNLADIAYCTYLDETNDICCT